MEETSEAGRWVCGIDRVLGKDFKAKGKNSIYCYEVIFIFHFYDNLFVLKRIFPKS